MGGSRVILDSNVFVSAFTSLEGPSRQLSRIVLSGSAEAQIPVPLFAEYEEASVSRPMIQQRCPLPPAEQTRLFDAFRSRTQLIELYCRWLHKLTRQQLDAGLPTHSLYPHMSISDSRHDVASVSGLKNSRKWSRASVAQFIPKNPMLTNGH
jgi:hypothetical protein